MREPGLLPRLINEILETMSKEKKKDSNNESDLQVTMLEIYQEKLYDLLGVQRDKLVIRDVNGKVDVCRLTSHNITSSSDAVLLMDKAAANR